MRSLIGVTLISTFLPTVNAGIYYYPSYRDGIEVRCKDGMPRHIVEVNKAGRGMKLEGDGEDQYSWPIIHVYPEARDDNYEYFPSTTSSCSYRELNEEEKNSLILKAFKTCFGTKETQEEKIERKKKFCFGWN